MPVSTNRPSWYLIHCKPREDERAREHLERQEYRCYLPTFAAERVRGGRKAVVQEPLFPRYLFIHLDEVKDNWYPIRSTRGVSNIVCCNGQPIPVRDQVIDGIRNRLAACADREPYLKPGERVEIAEGPFARLEAIFLASDGDERVVLLLNILQQDQRLSFPVGSVRKVREANVA
jgi:transcriptional antiterminator RfaH